jgi:hypothetical protein
VNMQRLRIREFTTCGNGRSSFCVLLLFSWLDIVSRLTWATDVQDEKWDAIRRNEMAVMDASVGSADIKLTTERNGTPVAGAGAWAGGQEDKDGGPTADAEASDDPFRLADMLKKEQPEDYQQYSSFLRPLPLVLCARTALLAGCTVAKICFSCAYEQQ